MKPDGKKNLGSTRSRRPMGVSILAILLLTLFPYHFQKAGALRQPFLDLGPASLNLDFFLNILLFVPFGLGLSAWLEFKRRPFWCGLAAALLGGAFLSGVVEFMQKFLPFRDSSLSDIAANSLGGAIGFLCYILSPDRIAGIVMAVEKPNLSKRTPRPGLAFFICLAAGIMISIGLQRRINLEGWNDAYPLLLGNERTGDRPWSGRLISFQVADRAVSEKQALLLTKNPAGGLQDPVASSDFLKSGIRMGGFAWKGGPPPMSGAAESGALDLTGMPWLESASTGFRIAQRLKKTNQFTVLLQCAPEKTWQSGPARILSISAGTRRRNLTIGQDKTSLIVRLRTPVTGENGMTPALEAPAVFTPGRISRIAVTYDGALLRAFANGSEKSPSLELGPATLLLGALASSSAVDLKGYKVLYYCIVFMPLGFLLSEMRGRSIFSPIFPAAGALFASVVFEALLSAASGKFFSPTNVAWGVLTTLLPLLLIHRKISGNQNF